MAYTPPGRDGSLVSFPESYDSFIGGKWVPPVEQSGIGRENHKMMLEHCQQTKNLLVSYSPAKLGFF